TPCWRSARCRCRCWSSGSTASSRKAARSRHSAAIAPRTAASPETGVPGRVLVDGGVNSTYGVDCTSTSHGESTMAAHLQPEFVAASELGGPALRAFFKLAEQWGLRISDQRRLLGD